MAGFIEKIKRSVANYILNKKLGKLNREKKLVNLHSARTIGILYNVNSQTTFQIVKTLVKELTSRQRQVMAIGFVNRKSIPNYCIAANSGYHFNLRDLNWYGAPKNDYIHEFINKEFDILIDLSLDDVFVFKYISGLSRSKFKVGRHNDNYLDCFDLMIKMESTTTLEAFIEQVTHYLVVIKSPENKTAAGSFA
jgi:hypothetical protein